MRLRGYVICTFALFVAILLFVTDIVPAKKPIDPKDKSSGEETQISWESTSADEPSEPGSEEPSETYQEFVVDDRPEMPVLSHASGFYPDSFELTMTAAEGVKIYYTTDGSLPDENATLYEAPVLVYDRTSEPNLYRSLERVTKNWDRGVSEPQCVKTPVKKLFVLRAVAIAEDGKKSDIANASFMINMSSYEDRQIISLIVDPDDFFGEENGIYMTGKAYDDWILGGRQGAEPEVNFELRGDESERPAAFQLFSRSKMVVSQDVGIRIQGAGVRSYAPRRLSIYSRKEISGSAYFTGELFGREFVHSFVTRDSALNNVCMALAEGRDVAVQNTSPEPTVLFINGERWDTWYLQEKYSDNYFKTRYGIGKKDLQFVKVTRFKEEEQQALNEYGFTALSDFIKNNDMSQDANYQKVCEQLDIQSYIDFIALNVIFSNMDYWENKNYLVFRSAADGEGWNDGKWRFGLYDMDCLTSDTRANTGYSTDYELDPFTTPGAYVPGCYNQLPLFASLRKNADFNRQFVLFFMDILNTNFTEANVHAVIDPVVKSDGIDASSYKKGFFLARPSYAAEQLKTNFGLTGTLAKVTLSANDASMGTLFVNTASPDLSGGSWTGNYYTDYPVTLSAVPAKGYRFVRWEGAVSSSEETVSVPVSAGGITVKAVFEPEN